jgi:putative polyketide hydroxylase
LLKTLNQVPAQPGSVRPLIELEAAALEAYGIGPAGGVLVRPDGIVAWRSHGAHSGEAVGAAQRAVLRL